MNEIVRHQPLTPSIWQMIKEIAPTLKESKLFGVARIEEAHAVMIKGHELGLPLSTSFEYIHIIQGKTSLSPKGALALIFKSGLMKDYKITDEKDKNGKPKSCMVHMTRTTGQEYLATFSIDDAKAAGIMKSGGGWEKYPANMLRWRAIGYCTDALFPDVIGGLYRADELGADITPEGNVIQAEWTVEEPVNHTLDSVIARGYSPDQILNANGGSIPLTQDEFEKVLQVLEGDA